MKRRIFVLGLGSVALGWPLAGRAEQGGQTRRVGVLLGLAENDARAREQVAVFKKGLAPLGWTDGKNLKIDVRWDASDSKRAAAGAKELLALGPDVLVTQTTLATAAVRDETRAVPTVFVQVSDPIGSGFVKTFPQPGGNITGFVNLESSLAGKWLQVLREIAPWVKTASVMFNSKTAPYVDFYLRELRLAAEKLPITVRNAPVQSESDIQQMMAELGRSRANGLIVMTDVFSYVHRKLIIELALRYKMPVIYPAKAYVEDGGLVSYGIDGNDIFRRAAAYVDRILRGAKPKDLPVQLPTKFEFWVSTGAASAIGFTIPKSVLLRADRVIE